MRMPDRNLRKRKAGGKIIIALLLTGASLTLLSFELPAGWFKAGSSSNSYDMGIDPGSGEDGRNAATIRSTESNIDGFGTLMQQTSAEKYLGSRVRMSGLVKTKDVSQWAGLWLRIDGKNSRRSLAFDNMKDGKTDRSIKGTTDWKRYEIILDVPQNSSNMAYGALLAGTGQIWFDGIRFEIVDSTVATTGRERKAVPANREPVNLDFEK
jgi:hypothetical protein